MYKSRNKSYKHESDEEPPAFKVVRGTCAQSEVPPLPSMLELLRALNKLKEKETKKGTPHRKVKS